MSERESQALLDRFWLWFGPAWFRWLAVVSMMAVIKWLGDQSGDWLLQSIYVFSILVCWFHFSAFFCHDGSLLIRGIGNRGWRFLVALVLGSAIALLAFWLSSTLVTRIAALR